MAVNRLIPTEVKDLKQRLASLSTTHMPATTPHSSLKSEPLSTMKTESTRRPRLRMKKPFCESLDVKPISSIKLVSQPFIADLVILVSFQR